MKTINFDFDNLGGLQHVYAIPPTAFLKISKNYVNDQNFLELQQKESIIDLPVYANDTYIYNEEKSTSDAGDCWEVNIEGVIPKLNPDNQSIIEELERGLWYVVAQDANGEFHFCGQEDAWMLFTSNKTSGKSASNLNGLTFSFSCVQDEPTIFLSQFEEMTL